MLEIIFLVAVCGYFIQSVLFIIGLQKKFPKLEEDKLPTATVIVAARNEEENILRCLESLNELEYQEGKLEIILVDDRSTDSTGKIIDEFISDKSRFKKIITKKEIGTLKGKTNALANALEVATGDVILTTDADCTVHPLWVKTIASFYTGNVALVNGFTTQETHNGFSGMQAIDFVYLLTVASGTININQPISCIGNNMSYLRKAYFEVGGYESLPFSVTEDFNLLIAIHRLKKYKIIFPLEKDALVTSLPCKDLKSLYHQKKRWGVGGMKAPARGYILFVNGFVASLAALLTPLFFSPVWLYLAAFKVAIDFFVLYPVHKRLGIANKMKYFIQFQIYFLIYVVILPFVIFTNQRVTWKGRKY